MHEWTDDKILEIQKLIQSQFKDTRKEIVSQFEKINSKVKNYKDIPANEVLKLWNKNKQLDNFIKESAVKIKDLNKWTIKTIQKEMISIYLNNYFFGAFYSELLIAKKIFNSLPNSIVAKKFLEENPNEFTTLRYDEISSYSYIYIALNRLIKASIIKDRNDFKKDMDKYLSKLLTTANTTIETNATRIESTGRLEAFKFADTKYSGYEKQWLSTFDNKTRKTHRRLSQVSVALDKKFPNGLMYPGDVNGRASETMNCRCTIVVVNKKYPSNELGKDLDSKMLKRKYELWKEDFNDKNKS